jgi:hypothetical protein
MQIQGGEERDYVKNGTKLVAIAHFNLFKEEKE